MSVMAQRPRFFGIVKGEALKVSRQLSFWLMLAGSFVLLAIITLAITSASNIQDQLKTDPTGWAYAARDIFGTIFQIGSGIFLLIIGARLFAMEYSSGTIRIIYARGTLAARPAPRQDAHPGDRRDRAPGRLCRGSRRDPSAPRQRLDRQPRTASAPAQPVLAGPRDVGGCAGHEHGDRHPHGRRRGGDRAVAGVRNGRLAGILPGGQLLW